MAPNFCSVCGNILDVSTDESVKCDACGEVNSSLPDLSAFPPFGSLAHTSWHRYYTLRDDIYHKQFPFASSQQTRFEDADYHAQRHGEYPPGSTGMSEVQGRGDDLV
jgi:hypothetical protein